MVGWLVGWLSKGDSRPSLSLPSLPRPNSYVGMGAALATFIAILTMWHFDKDPVRSCPILPTPSILTDCARTTPQLLCSALLYAHRPVYAYAHTKPPSLSLSFTPRPTPIPPPHPSLYPKPKGAPPAVRRGAAGLHHGGDHRGGGRPRGPAPRRHHLPRLLHQEGTLARGEGRGGG